MKKKIVYISREMLWNEAFGGTAYTLSFLRALADAGYEIDCLITTTSKEGWKPWITFPKTRYPGMRFFIRNYVRIGGIYFPKPKALWPWALRLGADIFYTLFGVSVRHIISRKMLHSVGGKAIGLAGSELLPAETRFMDAYKKTEIHPPHCIVIGQTWMAGCLDSFSPASLKAILVRDVQFERNEGFIRQGLEPEISDWSREKEAHLLQKADLLLAIQDKEAQTLKTLAPACEILLLPKAETLKTPSAPQIPGRCLFVGSDVLPNVHGMRWFLDKVWPRILEKNPQASLEIVGKVCRELTVTSANVILSGIVDDLARPYSQAEICLVPLLFGSGLKIKLVEAMAYGKVCVSTSVGVQGMEDMRSISVLVADDPIDFADHMLLLMHNADKRGHMEENARQYVRSHLSEKTIYGPFFTRIERFSHATIDRH